MEKQEVEVKFIEEHTFSVSKDGVRLMTFDNESNVGDTYYDVMNLLKSLDIEVKIGVSYNEEAKAAKAAKEEKISDECTANVEVEFGWGKCKV